MLGIKRFKGFKSLESPKFKWDFLVRFIHWSIALLFFANHFITDPDDLIHEYFGYAIVGLIATRMIWAILPISPPSSKLSKLKPSIATVKAHLRDLSNRHFEGSEGHNPLGSLMVLAIWLSLLLATLSGYVATTDFGIDYDVDDIHEWMVDLVLYLVAIHIAAVVLLSLFFKVNLLKTISFSLKRKSFQPFKK